MIIAIAIVGGLALVANLVLGFVDDEDGHDVWWLFGFLLTLALFVLALVK